MKVFLSWSGSRSKKTAEILNQWLSLVIQATEPWMSSDIGKGAHWPSELAGNLEESYFGIICLTRENLNEPWILFEAGALSKTKDAHVCTFLLDLRPSDIKPPLSHFQATQFVKEDVLELINTINQVVGKIGERSLSEDKLKNVFDIFWSDLEQKLQKIKNEQPKPKQPVRSELEMLEEILEFIRIQEREKLTERERNRALRTIEEQDREIKRLRRENEILEKIVFAEKRR